MAQAKVQLARAMADSLARRGYGEATLADVIARSGTPRGSLYHFYPGGKEELVRDALELVDAWLHDRLRGARPSTPAAVGRAFIAVFAEMLDHGDSCGAGCPFTAIVVDDPSAQLRTVAAGTFARWQSLLTGLFAQTGTPDAADVASLFVAGCEGALILSRAERSPDAFDRVTSALLQHLDLRGAAG